MKIVCMKSGVLYRSQNPIFRYNAWPTVGKMDDGTLAVVFSGHRIGHVDPFGKLMMVTSHDQGKSWSAPQILIDSAVDDRDGGFLCLGSGRVIVTSFSARLEASRKGVAWRQEGDPLRRMAEGYADAIMPRQELEGYASKFVLSQNYGQTWSAPQSAPVSNTGGPALLRDGTVLYVGNEFAHFDRFASEGIEVAAYATQDEGKTWQLRGRIPVADYGRTHVNYCEPHALQLADGTIVCHIRTGQVWAQEPKTAIPPVHQSISIDGGYTWSVAQPVPIDGEPPFLTLLSDGTLLSVCGRRWGNIAILAAFSKDNGVSWDAGHVVDDYPTQWDMGYPTTVELSDGSLYTVYYCGGNDESVIRFAHWNIE